MRRRLQTNVFSPCTIWPLYCMYMLTPCFKPVCFVYLFGHTFPLSMTFDTLVLYGTIPDLSQRFYNRKYRCLQRPVQYIVI